MKFREFINELSRDNTVKDIEPDLDQEIIDAETVIKAKKLESDLKARYQGKYRDIIIDIENHYGKFNRMGKKKQSAVYQHYLGK